MSLKKLGLAALLSLAALPALAQQTQTVRIGATPGPHAQILEAVKPIAAKKGLDIKIVEFSDYVVPNTALAARRASRRTRSRTSPISTTRRPTAASRSRASALTVNFPIGIYSKKHKSLDALPNGATISIPNDPTNGGRALLLLQDKGLIKLKDGVGLQADAARRHREPEEAEVRRDRSRAGAARARRRRCRRSSTPTTRRQAGLDPVKDPIARENPKGPYVNLIAVRSEDKDKPWVKALVESYHTPEVKKFIEEKFKGAVLTSW